MNKKNSISAIAMISEVPVFEIRNFKLEYTEPIDNAVQVSITGVVVGLPRRFKIDDPKILKSEFLPNNSNTIINSMFNSFNIVLHGCRPPVKIINCTNTGPEFGEDALTSKPNISASGVIGIEDFENLKLNIR